MESWSTRSRRRKPPESIYTPLDMSSMGVRFMPMFGPKSVRFMPNQLVFRCPLYAWKTVPDYSDLWINLAAASS